jgi:hypothetical protein
MSRSSSVFIFRHLLEANRRRAVTDFIISWSCRSSTETKACGSLPLCRLWLFLHLCEDNLSHHNRLLFQDKDNIILFQSNDMQMVDVSEIHSHSHSADRHGGALRDKFNDSQCLNRGIIFETRPQRLIGSQDDLYLFDFLLFRYFHRIRRRHTSKPA